MSDVRKLLKFGWLMIGLAAVASLLLLIGLLNGLGFWAGLWSFLFIVLPLAAIGSVLLSKRWFKLSARTGRRL